MIPLKLLAIGKDWAQIRSFREQHEERGSFAEVHDVWTYLNKNSKSLSNIANSFLFLSKPRPGQVFGLVHCDTLFDSPLYRINRPEAAFWKRDLEILTECAMSGKVCGIVGADLSAQRYWWGHSLPHGTEHPVSCLDGCSVFFRRDLGLRFDEETFDGFHCHVEDLCLQAHAKGIPVVVPAVKADHVGQSTFDPAWQADYARYKQKLNEKWKGVVFQTT